ncbi:TIGR00730 family Rossman fold protein [Camelimonas abortus]|uniref:Cytokinin riboside 5'-monophosphate phosphoribohydrolase n=1 Tax=Camelimonas abortus TaxID=1017184 RepID=A0ABV7LEZ0_9HYPH
MRLSRPLSANRPGEQLAACVFCGSGAGARPEYAAAARRLGELLAGHGVRLVYGGGSIGLMGETARAALRCGGEVTGVIPEFLLRRELALKEAQDLLVVPDMHARKRLMYERADAFIALPGGIGTLEELVEQMTWAQLGAHNRPVLLVNTLGFWDPFLQLLEHMRREAFLRPGLDASCIVAATPEEALTLLLEAARNPGAPPQSSPERPAAPGPF